MTGSRATHWSTQQQLCPQRGFLFFFLEASRPQSTSKEALKQQGPVQDQQAFSVLDKIPTEVPDQHEQVLRGPTFRVRCSWSNSASGPSPTPRDAIGSGWTAVTTVQVR